MIEELALIRDFGISAATLVLMFRFMKWMTEKSFNQIQEAQKQINESNANMSKFMDCTFKENTKAMNRMVTILTDHVKTDNEVLKILKRRE